MWRETTQKRPICQGIGPENGTNGKKRPRLWCGGAQGKFAYGNHIGFHPKLNRRHLFRFVQVMGQWYCAIPHRTETYFSMYFPLLFVRPFSTLAQFDGWQQAVARLFTPALFTTSKSYLYCCEKYSSRVALCTIEPRKLAIVFGMSNSICSCWR